MKPSGLWLACLTLLLLTVPAFAQHSFTPEEIAAGGQLYRTNCLNCHGPGGDAISNAPLMTGKFRRGNSDEELVRMIRNGIAGTPMTAQSSITEMQAGTIVGFLRSVATAPTAPIANTAALPAGNAARGKTVFEGKGNCLSCHRVQSTGSQFGPDLSSIGNPPIGRGGAPAGVRGAAPATTIPAPPSQPAGPDVALLQQSILDPNAVVSNTNRYVQLALRDGSTLNAKLLNQDTYALQVLNFREQLQTIPRTNLRSEVVFRSPMPSYRDRLTTQELADVLAYLVTLKGQSN